MISVTSIWVFICEHVQLLVALITSYYLNKKSKNEETGIDEKDYSGLAAYQEIESKLDYGLPIGSLVNRVLLLPIEYLLQHVIVFAPSGSGKTESYIIPWLTESINYDISSVTVDVKGDLIDRVGCYCTDNGNYVIYFNPDDIRSMKNNFLQEIESERDINVVVDSLYGESETKTAEDDHFRSLDKRHLNALIRLGLDVLKDKFIPYNLYRMSVNKEYVSKLIKKCSDVDVKDDLSDVLESKKQSYSEKMAGVANKLSMFRDSNIKKITSSSDFKLQSVFDRATVFILGAPLSYGEPAKVLCSLYLRLLQSKLYRRFSGWDIPILFLLDEFPRIKIDGEEFLSVCRSAGAGVISILQDIDQLKDDIAETYKNNCATLIAMHGCGPVAAEWLSNKFGERKIYKKQMTAGESASGILGEKLTRSVSNMITEEWVPVLRPREIMYPPNKRLATVHCRLASEKPFLVDTTKSELLPFKKWDRTYQDVLCELDKELDKAKDNFKEVAEKEIDKLLNSSENKERHRKKRS